MRKDNLKVMSRLKRIYKSGHDWYFDAVEKVSNRIGLPTTIRCESVKDFLDRSKYAKLLKKTRVPFRSKMGQIEQHYKNKKSRVLAKRQILEGIQEFEDRYED